MAQTWAILFVVGLVLFLVGVLFYEAKRRRSMPTWAMVAILAGSILVIISAFVYLYKQRHTLPGITVGVPLVEARRQNLLGVSPGPIWVEPAVTSSPSYPSAAAYSPAPVAYSPAIPAGCPDPLTSLASLGRQGSPRYLRSS